MINQYKSVIEKLPHSKERVPYTYHHDYLRLNSETYKDASRSYIAVMDKVSTEEDLYATCLVKLLDEHGSGIFRSLTIEDFAVCEIAVNKTDELLKKIDNN